MSHNFNAGLAVGRYRWGSCLRPGCSFARRPYVYRSGKKQGDLVLLCNGFGKRDATGNRRCWRDAPFDFQRYHELPKFLRQGHESLKNSFARGSR